MTTKTQGLNYVQTAVGYDTVTYGAGGGTSNVYNYLNAGSYKSTTGVKTPDFYNRRKRGDLIPPTLFSQEEWDATTAGSWSLTSYSSGDAYVADFFLPTSYNLTISPPSGLLQGWIDQYESSVYVGGAVARLYNRGFDALTFIAELRETAKLFKDVLGRFFGMLRRHSLEDLTSGWLELRYGWRPLVKDIEDINELLISLSENPDFVIFSERYGKTENLYDVTDSKGYMNYGSFQYDAFRHTTTASIGLRGTAASKIEPPRITFDPIVTAWELVPYSFVIDWFFNVGSMLNALHGQSYHSDLVTSYGTQLNYVTQSELIGGVGIGDFYGHVTSTAVYSGSITNRTPVTPSFIPSVNINLDALKVADLMALLTAALLNSKFGRRGKGLFNIR